MAGALSPPRRPCRRRQPCRRRPSRGLLFFIFFHFFCCSSAFAAWPRIRPASWPPLRGDVDFVDVLDPFSASRQASGRAVRRVTEELAVVILGLLKGGFWPPAILVEEAEVEVAGARRSRPFAELYCVRLVDLLLPRSATPSPIAPRSSSAAASHRAEVLFRRQVVAVERQGREVQTPRRSSEQPTAS